MPRSALKPRWASGGLHAPRMTYGLKSASSLAFQPGVPHDVQVNTFLSLDGVMQAPGGAGEDPAGGFDLEGWSVNYWGEAMGQRMGELINRPFDLLLGRKTYQIFAAHWPQSDEEFAKPLNQATKYVVTNSLGRAEWGPSQTIKGDVVPQIQRPQLKEQDGPELQVHGSSDLLQTLIKHKLVDQYNVMIFPVVLDKGKATVRSRHHSRRSASDIQQDREHRCHHGHVRACRSHPVGNVQAAG
jgi:dihydrofolate reductase